MTAAPRIYADFNNADSSGRLRLNIAGSQADLATLGERLMPGLDVIVYCEELEAEGVLERSSEEGGIWVARIKWIPPE